MNVPVLRVKTLPTRHSLPGAFNFSLAAASRLRSSSVQMLEIPPGVSASRSGAAHVAFEPIKTLGPCDV